MPERIALVTLDGQQPYLDIKLQGKEYTIRVDEMGIHVSSSRAIDVKLTDIYRSTWLIIK